MIKNTDSQTRSQITNIGVFTSGGDAPGMNAAIRSVVRSCKTANVKCTGILRGYAGLAKSQFIDLGPRDVANILQRGGTILKTARYPEMHQAETRTAVAEKLRAAQIDAIVAIGGDGTLAGAHLLWEEQGIPFMLLPGTIDNDIWGTDWTIGYDTAMNTAVQAVDKIRDTADSHDRLFVIEVMGRRSGALASAVGLACGAEIVFTPEGNFTLDMAVNSIQESVKKGKRSSIIVTTEGQKPGRAYDLADALRKRLNVDPKVCVLGHIQRGGSPSAFDRILASSMGAIAVDSLLEGKTDALVGCKGDKIVLTDCSEVLTHRKNEASNWVNLAFRLAT